MKTQDFTKQMPGRLVPNPESNWAFIPDALPPEIEYDARLVTMLGDANRSLGELCGVGQMLPNPHMLIGPFMRREAILSSRIEGTYATEEELMLFEVAPQKHQKSDDVREVSNYVSALDHGLKRLGQLPVSVRLIKELHKILLMNVRGADKHPGEFRTGQNYIGKLGTPPEDARFVPPPPSRVVECMSDLEKFIHAEDEIPALIKLALVHYQFETIHPFADGNGRIGRLLISLLLCERKLLPKPLLYLSAYFEKHRDEYVDHLLYVSQKSAWQEWICFFLKGMDEQSRDAIDRSRRLLTLRQEYRSRMQKARASALILQLIDDLFNSWVVTIPMAATHLGVTYRSAQLIVEKLLRAGILKELRPEAKRDRAYYVPGILSVISSSSSVS